MFSFGRPTSHTAIAWKQSTNRALSGRAEVMPVTTMAAADRVGPGHPQPVFEWQHGQPELLQETLCNPNMSQNTQRPPRWEKGEGEGKGVVRPRSCHDYDEGELEADSVSDTRHTMWTEQSVVQAGQNSLMADDGRWTRLSSTPRARPPAAGAGALTCRAAARV